MAALLGKWPENLSRVWILNAQSASESETSILKPTKPRQSLPANKNAEASATSKPVAEDLKGPLQKRVRLDLEPRNKRSWCFSEPPTRNGSIAGRPLWALRTSALPRPGLLGPGKGDKLEGVCVFCVCLCVFFLRGSGDCNRKWYRGTPAGVAETCLSVRRWEHFPRVLG